jgi:hypothetical protein
MVLGYAPLHPTYGDSDRTASASTLDAASPGILGRNAWAAFQGPVIFGGGGYASPTTLFSGFFGSKNFQNTSAPIKLGAAGASFFTLGLSIA